MQNIEVIVRAHAPMNCGARLSRGAFFDRFGTEQIAILADPSPTVQAFIKTVMVREYIDLTNPAIELGLSAIEAAGHPIDVVAILHTPVSWGEQIGV